MKISELIVRLQKIIKDKGDCEVYLDNVYGADIAVTMGISFEYDVAEYFDDVIE